jgi:hypothetical protein
MHTKVFYYHEYIYIYIYIYIYKAHDSIRLSCAYSSTLFITLGGGSIDQSLGPVNSLIDRVNRTNRPMRTPTRDRGCAPTRAEYLRVPRDDRPCVSRSVPMCYDSTRLSHFTSPLSHFYASVSYFLVSLGQLTTVDSTIFNSELSLFRYSELSLFSYTTQSFYDFVSHSATATSVILLENSVILRCYNTQLFMLRRSTILCFAAVSSFIFMILSVIFLLLQ